MFLLSFFFLLFFFFSRFSISSISFFSPRRVLSNHWMDCSEIWGYGIYGCEDVQVGYEIQPKTAKFCPDYYSLTTEGIVLNFLDMISNDI